MPKITKLEYEKWYSDGSGVEFAVRYDSRESDSIVLERIHMASFPIDELDWLIACLIDIRDVVRDTP